MIEAIHFLDELYEDYEKNPQKMDAAWVHYFQDPDHAVCHFNGTATANSIDPENYFFNEGYAFADTYPMPKEVLQLPWEKPLSLEEHFSKTLGVNIESVPEFEALKQRYCGSLGVQFTGSVEEASWLKARLKSMEKSWDFKNKKELWHSLLKTHLFEKFLHTKFIGAKRFSIEGHETLVPMLEYVIDIVTSKGAEDVVIGMSHRGRISVMTQVLFKPLEELFAEFKGLDGEGAGDVKYHKGYHNCYISGGKKVQMMLMDNPSHLESVGPVALGYTKGRSVETQRCPMGIIVHGDAAISGQGVVYESLQLSQIPGYQVGGTLHIILNNQVGFTTSPDQGRSTPYCTDIAKAFDLPVFRVSVYEPEQCLKAIDLALSYKERFKKDVFIELNGFRRYGHNESDEPNFTQPKLYQWVKTAPAPHEKYQESVGISEQEQKEAGEALQQDYQKQLDRFNERLAKGKTVPLGSKMRQAEPLEKVKTAVAEKKLKELAEQFCTIPSSFSAHKKIEQLCQARRAQLESKEPAIDWGMGELLAYASLLDEGIDVRLSGQDCGRGTFSHRHCVWSDQKSNELYNCLEGVGEKGKGGRISLVNSPLSEYGVMGFDFGYSLAHPDHLCIWEAQFGDFCNTAQVIIDQYIASGEAKWGQQSRLALFLPHGYEGMGAEHSSARLERFLQLSAEDNWRLCQPTLPAQHFHLIRAHSKSKTPKPLICMTPKGFLRHPLAVSSVDALSKGSFSPVIYEGDPKAKKVIALSGRVYFDVKAHLSDEKGQLPKGIGILRFEQLYPFPKEALESLKLQGEFIWMQDDPQNMGAWQWIASHFEKIAYVGRSCSASSATGYPKRHEKEQLALLKELDRKLG